MNKQIIDEVRTFISTLDTSNMDSKTKKAKAQEYLKLLSSIDKKEKPVIANQLETKLRFIINQIEASNFHQDKKEALLGLVSVSVSDYIIRLVREKHLTNPIEIARFVYIELSKVLYYDITYVKTNEREKRIICDTPVDPKREKIFSYVVCTQWLQLYQYILSYFGINVTKKGEFNQDHVWGEIVLRDKIIVVDATDYIDSSIDLSNAKSMSPTVGFAVLPKEYSGINLYNIFNDPRFKNEKEAIRDAYKLNRELDMSLGYIDEEGYPVEKIIRETDLFRRYPTMIGNSKDRLKCLQETRDFFKKLAIPHNIDGYELFAYYNKFLRQLPKDVSGNVKLITLYVDAYSYKQKMTKKAFLQAPDEYLEYLERLIFNRYYRYLSQADNIEVLEKMRKGIITGQELRDEIANLEMKIAQVNRSINSYYAINQLQIFEPETCDSLSIQVYEPMMGSKSFASEDDFQEYRKTLVLK